MTTAGVLAALLRRWYVGLGGLAATVGVMVVVLGVPGVYTSTADVVLIAPRGDTGSAQLVGSGEDLIAAAGLVERLVNGGAPRQVETSQEVPLEGRGFRDASSVKLPNSGGQWDYSFQAPVLRVQVVGEDAEGVRRRRDQLLAEIDRTLLTLQRSDGVRRRSLITTRVVPDPAPVAYVPGHPSRAAGIVLLIGTMLTCFACVTLDRRMLQRARAGAPAQPEVSTVSPGPGAVGGRGSGSSGSGARPRSRTEAPP